MKSYRAHERLRSSRGQVDTRFAIGLGDVFDTLDPAQVDQLAEDLSGRYGPYRVEFQGAVHGEKTLLVLAGRILCGERPIGRISTHFSRDGADMVVCGGFVFVDSEFRGRGFSTALTAAMEAYYRRCGVDRIESLSIESGAYLWSRQGYTWDLRSGLLQLSLDNIKAAAARLSPQVSEETQAVLAEVVARLEPDHPRRPEPVEVADLATPGEPALGRRLLDGAEVYLVKYLRGRPAAVYTPIPKRWSGS